MTDQTQIKETENTHWFCFSQNKLRVSTNQLSIFGMFFGNIIYIHLSIKLQEETSATCPEPSKHQMCDGCEKRLHLIEQSYKLKLLSAQLKVNKYKKELSEQSHKMTKLQRKVIVLQTAMKVMSMRKRMSTPKRSESSSETTSLM